MKVSKKSVGQQGEALARQFLLGQGYEIVATSYRCGRREIDIIAREQQELAFIEVKCSTSLAFGQPEERVDRKKQSHLISIAQHYMAENHCETMDARFDVIAVLLTPALELININHLKYAFEVQPN